LREIEGREEGACPPVDLAAEKRNGDFVRGLIESGRIDTVHDLSDGGLLVALAEMALAGTIGATLARSATLAEFFGEDQARYLVACADAETVLAAARSAAIPAALLGHTGGDRIVLAGGDSVALAALRRAHESWFPAYMAAQT
jgi:phosphoribosylformylglycinamidine synthase